MLKLKACFFIKLINHDFYLTSQVKIKNIVDAIKKTLKNYIMNFKKLSLEEIIHLWDFLSSLKKKKKFDHTAKKQLN